MIARAAFLLALVPGEPALAEGAALAFRAGNDAIEVPSGSAMAEQVLDHNGRPAIGVTLSEDLVRRFGELTGSHVDELLDILICGDVALSPRIVEPIYNSQLQIAGNFTVSEATELAVRIRRDDCTGFTPS